MVAIRTMLKRRFLRLETTLRRYHAFIRFLLQFLIVLVLGGSASVAAYWQAQQIVRRSVLDEASNALEKNAGLFRQRLQELDRIGLLIGRNPQVRLFFHMGDEIPLQYTWKLNEVRDLMSTFPAINDLIEENYLFYFSNNLFVSSTMIETRLDYYYGTFFFHENMELEEWMAYVKKSDLHKQFIPSLVKIDGQRPESFITYYSYIPIAEAAGPKALLAFVLPIEEVGRFFLQFSHMPFFIHDAETKRMVYSNVAAQSFFDENIDDGIEGDAIGQGELLDRIERANHASDSTVLSVSDKDFSYSLLVRETHISSSLKKVRTVYLIIIACAFVPGMFIALFLAFKRSRPIRHITSRLAGFLGIQSRNIPMNMEFIETGLDFLVQKNQNLENQIPLLRSGFSEKLIRGGFADDDEVLGAARTIGLKVSAKFHFVVRIYFPPKEGSNRSYFDSLRIIGMISDQLSLLAGMVGCQVHRTERNTTVMICHSDVDEDHVKKDLKDALSEVLSAINKQITGNIRIAVGQFYPRIIDVSKSFLEVQMICKFWFITALRDIAWYSDLPVIPMGYTYSVEEENRIFRLLFLGKETELNDHMRRILRENFSNTSFSLLDRQSLMTDIQGTLYKVIRKIQPLDSFAGEKLKTMMHSLVSLPSLDAIEKRIAAYFSLCIQSINQRKKSHNSELRDNILADLTANFNDSNLCLATIAEKYHLTEQYLSQFIKEQTGFGFASYLEQLRMARIIEDFQATSLSITRIAEKNGYANSSTFYKAFRRVYSISPSEYRQRFS